MSENKQKAVELLNTLNWKAFGLGRNYIEINKKGKIISQKGDIKEIVSELNKQAKVLQH
jgi:hypothetical protein